MLTKRPILTSNKTMSKRHRMHVNKCMPSLSTIYIVNTAANQNNSHLQLLSIQVTSHAVYKNCWLFVVVAYATEDKPMFYSGLSVDVSLP